MAEERVRREYQPEKVLQNYRALIAAMPKMNETEVKMALRSELSDQRRLEFIFRLHRRFTNLRRCREQKEYGIEGYDRRREEART